LDRNELGQVNNYMYINSTRLDVLKTMPYMYVGHFNHISVYAQTGYLCDLN